MKQFRLFIGNIPPGTAEHDLKKEFGAYGIVKSIELKSKEQSFFGFINIDTDDKVINQCIREFSEQKYKGVFLNVSRAKESFLDRLKREREEAEQKNSQKTAADHDKVQEEKVIIAELPSFKTTVPDDESSSSSSSESESEPEEKPPVRQQPIVKPKNPDEFVKKWNCEGYLEHGKLKIVPITGDVTEIIEVRKKKNTTTKELKADDEKRLKGLESIKNTYDNQKKLIQSALSGGSSNKKIVFEDNSEIAAKVNLFDNDEEDVISYKRDFAIKHQFQGQHGEELFKLHAKTKQDERFALDSRFAEPAAQSKKEKAKQQKKSAGEKEKDSQLKILQEMGTATGGVKEKHQKEMIRFDPNKSEHSKFNKKPNENSKIEHGKNAASVQKDEFHVSDERYVKINSNIKEAFDGGGFSLLQAYGKTHTEEEQNTMENTEGGQTFAGKRFRYDSSDDEEPNSKKHKTVQDEKPLGQKKPKNIFKEKFFFQVDDARFKEGLKFFTSKAPRQTHEEVTESRKALKKVVKDKVKKQTIRASNKEMYTKSFRKPVGRKFQKPKRRNFNKN